MWFQVVPRVPFVAVSTIPMQLNDPRREHPKPLRRRTPTRRRRPGDAEIDLAQHRHAVLDRELEERLEREDDREAR
jgi:hypothetical protein